MEHRFKVGQFVKRVPQGDYVRISGVYGEKKPSYSIQYVSIDFKTKSVQSGGGSGTWDESMFAEVTEPLEILVLKDIELDEEQRKLYGRIKDIERERVHINYALDIVNSALKEVVEIDEN